MDEKILTLKKWLDESSRVVFFGGAGVSTASGLPDFRSADGLYRQHQKLAKQSGHKPIWADFEPEYLLSRACCQRQNPIFLRYVLDVLYAPDAEPNLVHRTLAAWEKLGKLSYVITQNIDRLHQKAGSQRVCELHGFLGDLYCPSCQAHFSLQSLAEKFQDATQPPCCPLCAGPLDSDVTLYGDPLDTSALETASAAIASADLLIVAGTSLSVYPAAALPDLYPGDRLVLINQSPTAQDRRANLLIHEDMNKVFAALA